MKEKENIEVYYYRFNKSYLLNKDIYINIACKHYLVIKLFSEFYFRIVDILL